MEGRGWGPGAEVHLGLISTIISRRRRWPAAFTPLQLARISTRRNTPTLLCKHALKRAEARGPMQRPAMPGARYLSGNSQPKTLRSEIMAMIRLRGVSSKVMDGHGVNRFW